MARKLVSNHSPYLFIDFTIDLIDRTISQEKAEALVDTGFTGDLSVPPQIVRNGKTPVPDLYANLTLANGSKARVPVYEGTVVFRELEGEIAQPIDVSVFILGDEVLVGRSLMDHFRVTLDHGKQIIVEP